MNRSLTNIFLLFVIVSLLGSTGCQTSKIASLPESPKPTNLNFLPVVMNLSLNILPVQGIASDYSAPSVSPSLPNLHPYAPAGWANPLVVSPAAGLMTGGPVYAGTSNYLSWAVINNSNVMAVGQSYTCLYLDGVEVARWYANNHPKRSYAFSKDWNYPILVPGVHTLKIQADCTNIILETNESDNTWSQSYFWQPGVQVSIEQGFDACTAPSLNEMTAWWWKSPYYNINIYFGGISRGCRQPNLNPAWVQTVTQMGWGLIPTWVGLQAPCSVYRNPFSNSPSIAYKQGRAEADSAINAAAALGLTAADKKNTVIYYDLEAFNTTNLACRQAVESFINGWVSRVHELGSRAGVYSTSSAISYFWSIPNPPDDIWAAWWKTPPLYDPTMTVWNLPSITNDKWDDHQRIRQYAGGHNETYGNVKINIDSNALDGHVVGVDFTPSGTGMLSQNLAEPPADQISNMGMLSAQSGWALLESQLLWTDDSGQSWSERTPRLTSDEVLSAVTFLDSSHGWAASLSMPDADGQQALGLHRTYDSGQTWQAQYLDGEPGSTGAVFDQAAMTWVDDQHGWVAVRQAGGLNFSFGKIYRTQDGGDSWQSADIPTGAPVAFFNSQVGYTAGGPAGDELYLSLDSGQTWQQQFIAQGLSAEELPVYSLPVLQPDGSALLSVQIQSTSNPRLELYTTHDQGNTWQLTSSVPLAVDPTGGMPTAQIAGPQAWQAYSQALPSDSKALTPGATLPQGTQQVQFADPQHGWARSSLSDCTGAKPSPIEPNVTVPLICSAQSQLWATADGGLTWQPLTLP